MCTVLAGITLAACMGLSHPEVWFIGWIQRNLADVIKTPAWFIASHWLYCLACLCHSSGLQQLLEPGRTKNNDASEYLLCTIANSEGEHYCSRSMENKVLGKALGESYMLGNLWELRSRVLQIRRCDGRESLIPWRWENPAMKPRPSGPWRVLVSCRSMICALMSRPARLQRPRWALLVGTFDQKRCPTKE